LASSPKSVFSTGSDGMVALVGDGGWPCNAVCHDWM
jgi:hypothetical protein